MFAHHYPNTERAPFRHFCPTPRQVRFHGAGEIVQVDLVDDADGPLLGWLATGEERPSLIQPAIAFPMQFPGSVEGEVARGRGEAVRLRVENVQKELV